MKELPRLAKDLLFNAVYHKSLPFEAAIEANLLNEYNDWVKEYEQEIEQEDD